MRQLVDQGVDAIIVCCSNPTALNQTVQYAYEQAACPTFSAVGYLTSPYAVNSSANFVVGGHMLGEWMAKEIGGKGNMLIVEGIPGTSASDSQDGGIKEALAKYPDIKVVGSIAGMWTDQVAQAEIQKWLATNPGELDGIIIQSASELGALAGAEAVRPRHGAVHHRRRDSARSATGARIPTTSARPSRHGLLATISRCRWNIMMRTLQGQGPKVQSILAKPRR